VVETKSRRRGAELEQAILEAAWAELSKVGYVRFTIEAVAARAGTSKPVIYRRWGSRVPVEPGTPDTGSLRSDLLTLFNRIARRATQMMSEVIAGVAGEAFRHPEVHALFRRQLEVSPLYDAIQTIVKRAVERGELPPVTVPVRALRLPVVMVRGEAMVAGGSVPAETITELVDDVYLPLLRGLASGPATT
jgi:AcrR family transcriptional regulator